MKLLKNLCITLSFLLLLNISMVSAFAEEISTDSGASTPITVLEGGKSYQITNTSSTSGNFKLEIGLTTNKIYDVVSYRGTGEVMSVGEGSQLSSILISAGGYAVLTMRDDVGNFNFTLPDGFEIKEVDTPALQKVYTQKQEIYKVVNNNLSKTENFYINGLTTASSVENVTIYKSTGEVYSSYDNYGSSVSVPSGGYGDITVGDEDGIYFYYPSTYHLEFTAPITVLHGGKSYQITNTSSVSGSFKIDVGMTTNEIYDVVSYRATGDVMSVSQGSSLSSIPISAGGYAILTLRDSVSNMKFTLPDGFQIKEVDTPALQKVYAQKQGVYKVVNHNLSNSESFYIDGIDGLNTSFSVENVTVYKSTGEVYSSYNDYGSSVRVPAGGYGTVTIGDKDGVLLYYPSTYHLEFVNQTL